MKLIVLDFYKDITYIYTIDKIIDNKVLTFQKLKIKQELEVSNLLKEMGHSPAHCQWMLTKNEIIIK